MTHYCVQCEVLTSLRMDAKFFKLAQRRAGVTSFDLGRAINRDRSVISRILNEQQRMTLDQAKAFAEVLNLDLPEVLEKAGLAEAPIARQFTPGFAESDAVAWIGKGSEDRRIPELAAAFGARPGVDVWTVRSSALSLMGYLPGDFILVDTHQAERVKAGDAVLAQVYDNAHGSAVTVIRRFEPPVLVAACAQPDDRRVHVVDGINVVIRGKIVASWRL